MTAFKCYVGSSEYSRLEDCSRLQVPDANRCMKTISYGYTSYTCSTKLRVDLLEAQDNGCSTFNGVKTCICDTEGCNPDPYGM